MDKIAQEYIKRRLYWKVTTDLEIFDEKKIEHYKKQYLSDDQKDRYIIRTRWHITSSKLKTFINDPLEYYLKYVLELPELKEKKSTAFVLWNAYETIVTEWMEWFNKKYYIDKWYLKDDLADKLSNWDEEHKKELMKLYLDDLRDLFYKPWERIRLTHWEWKKIIAMFYESSRQTMFDLQSKDYEYQKYFEAQFGDLKLSGSLDRYSKTQAMIRDFKTSGQFDNFEYDMEYTRDYITQVAFYYALAYIVDGIECDVYIDVQETVDPYRSDIFKITKATLHNRMITTIKPALIKLNEYHKTGNRSNISRYVAKSNPYYPIIDSAIISDPIFV